MKKKNFGSTIILIITALVVIGLLAPFIYVSKFAYPWADDFTYGADAHIAFLNTGSMLKGICAAVKSTMETYVEWQGTYTSCFLMAIQPAIWNIKLYHLTGVFMLTTMFLSYLCLSFVVLKKMMGVSGRASATCALLIFIVSVQCVPGIAEGFTWYNSAVHYTFMHSLSVFLYSMVLLFVHDCMKKARANKGGKMILKTVLICILAILTAGGNNITTLTGMLVLILLELFLLFFGFVVVKDFKKTYLYTAKKILPITISYAVGFLLNILSPGNLKRMMLSGVENKSGGFITVVIDSFKVGYMEITERLALEIICVLMIVAVLVWHSITTEVSLDKTEFSFPLPGLVVLTSFCLFSAMFSPLIYIQDTDVELEYLYREAITMARTENIIFFAMILLLAGDILYFLGWIYKKGLHFSNRIIGIVIVAVSVVAIIFICGSNLRNGSKRYMTAEALDDIKNETASYYGIQMAENTMRLEADNPEVLVMPIAVDPRSLYPFDAADWIEGTRLFYQKESVSYESEPYVFER